MKKLENATIDGYIALFPPPVQKKLKEMRLLIRRAAPGATEKISYQMPAFALNGIIVYFAAYARHIGFYPTASGIAHFKAEVSKYKSSKGAVQFPMDEPLPAALIQRIVKFRVDENLKKKAR